MSESVCSHSPHSLELEFGTTWGTLVVARIPCSVVVDGSGDQGKACLLNVVALLLSLSLSQSLCLSLSHFVFANELGLGVLIAAVT